MRDGGFYQEMPPPSDLGDVVACMWVRVVRARRPPSPIPIIPDGCSDVMIYDDHPPIVAGPDASTRWITIGDGTVITAARLKPGGVRAVFGCSATTILNSQVRLSDLVSDGRQVYERLLLAAGVTQRQAILADWIRGRLRRTASPDRDIREACRLLTADPRADVCDVADRVGLSARGIRRHFHAACGYGPKHFQRIMRMQIAIRAAHGPERLSAADIAAAAGYADQPHMTREFRDIAGFTPANYLSTARPEFGVWLTGEWTPGRNVQDFDAPSR